MQVFLMLVCSHTFISHSLIHLVDCFMFRSFSLFFTQRIYKGIIVTLLPKWKQIMQTRPDQDTSPPSTGCPGNKLHYMCRNSLSAVIYCNI
uniref:Secreted protein n=1 Tax=Arion vulgaris TaxID=1028688 RepID=A0A0B6YAV7_9EUPU